MVSFHKCSPWYSIICKIQKTTKTSKQYYLEQFRALLKSLWIKLQNGMFSKSKRTRKPPGGGDIWQVWDAKIWTFWGQTKIILYFFIKHKMTESNSLRLSQEILVDSKGERQMEITNLDQSPSGFSRSGIIAPVDIVSKCNLVYNQSLLLSNGLGEIKQSYK